MKNDLKKQIAEWPLYLKLMGVVCIVLAMATVLAFVIPQKPVQGEFIPPAFDTQAVAGKPDVPQALAYERIWKEGMHFSSWICCAPVQVKDGATVFFTNPADNEVWMKLRLLNEKGETVGESGLLKPGEYVRTVALTKKVSNGDTIKLKIMTYEPDTYYSMGSVAITTVMGG